MGYLEQSVPGESVQERLIARIVWLILAAPLAVITSLYLTGDWFYGEYVQATGDWATKLLMLAMAITPLRHMFPRAPLLVWLQRQRRFIGVAVFGYAVAHFLAYLFKLGAAERIVSEALEPGMLAGWVALLLFVPLAVTSNDLSVARLGRRWKHLHRLIYVAALLTFLHWILLAFDPIEGFVHAGILFALEVYRLVMRHLDRQGSVTSERNT